MISTAHLLAFVLSAFVLIVVPGPSVLFTVGRALALGRRAGIASAAGNSVGAYGQAVAVAFGVGAIVERSIVVFTVIKLAGAAYLVYLGVQAIRRRHWLAGSAGPAAAITSPRRAMRQAFVVGLTNPKVIVFFLAVLPQFVHPAGAHPSVQMLLFGAVFTTMAFLLDSCWALGAGTARQWFTRSPQRLAQLGAAGGVAMIGLGARLAVTGRHD